MPQPPPQPPLDIPFEPDPFPELSHCWTLERLPEEFFVLKAAYSTAPAGTCEPWPDPMPPWEALRPDINLVRCIEREGEYLPNEMTVGTVAVCGPTMKDVRGTVIIPEGETDATTFVDLPWRDYDWWFYYKYNSFVLARGEQ